MSLNCNEINLILSELDLEGSFIQEVIQPGFDILTLRTIKNGNLKTVLICTSQNSCRMHETNQKITKNKKPLRFHEYLRSHVQGMRINSCRQIGLDRIIKLDVSTWQEKMYIYIRLWSNAANVIVTDENNVIQDCMFRRPKKKEVSGELFLLEEKIPAEEEKALLLQKFPIRDFSDFSTEYKSLHPNKDFLSLTFNQKIDAYYSEHAATLSRESLLAQAEKWYNVKHSKMTLALEKLLEKQKCFKNSDNLRHIGDLILAYQSEANGNGFDCIDYETGQKMHIVLDPKKNAHQNAQFYYEQYKKAQSGLEDLEHDILLSKKELSRLEEEYQAMLNEKSVIKLEQLLRKDTTPKQKTDSEKNKTGLKYELEGWTILVGRTANENDELLRHSVKGQDLWLHTRDYAGGYVFIKARKEKTVPLDILLYAGNLAVYHSKARKNGEADLYYTQVKHLRRAKDGPKGLVLPTQEKNLFIKLDHDRMRKLDEYEV